MEHDRQALRERLRDKIRSKHGADTGPQLAQRLKDNPYNNDATNGAGIDVVKTKKKNLRGKDVLESVERFRTRRISHAFNQCRSSNTTTSTKYGHIGRDKSRSRPSQPQQLPAPFVRVDLTGLLVYVCRFCCSLLVVGVLLGAFSVHFTAADLRLLCFPPPSSPSPLLPPPPSPSPLSPPPSTASVLLRNGTDNEYDKASGDAIDVGSGDVNGEPSDDANGVASGGAIGVGNFEGEALGEDRDDEASYKLLREWRRVRRGFRRLFSQNHLV